MTAWGKDFSYGYYRRLVEKASAWMTLRLFREVPTLDPAGQHLLLRHDVDCSLTEALQLAHFEARLGLRSSYFVMMHSLLYDVGQSSAVRELAAMGHEVGVHFDCPPGCDPNDSAAVEALIDQDCRRLEDILGEPVRSISFHRPIQQFLHGPLLLAGRVNAYAASLMRWYISDSRGSWRCGSPLQELGRRRHGTLQMLTHPIWWGREHVAPQDRLQLLFLRLTHGKNLRQRALVDAHLIETMPGIRRNGFFLPDNLPAEWSSRSARSAVAASDSRYV